MIAVELQNNVDALQEQSAVDALTKTIEEKDDTYKAEVGAKIATDQTIADIQWEKKEHIDKNPELLPQIVFTNKTKEFINDPMQDISDKNMEILKGKWISLDKWEIQDLIKDVIALKEPTNKEEELKNKETVIQLQNIVQYFYPIIKETGVMKECTKDGGFGPNTGYGVLNMLEVTWEKIAKYKEETKKIVNENNIKYNKPPFKRADE